MAGRLHETAVSFVNNIINRRFNQYVRTATNSFLDPPLGGEFERSRKVPDVAIWDRGQGTGDRLLAVVEVASSQCKKDLHQVMEFWFRTYPDLPRVILLNITEDTPYRPPNNPNLKDLKAILENEEFGYPPGGPVRDKNQHQWVGNLTFTWEVWVRPTRARKPKQTFKKDFLPITKPGLRLPLFKINGQDAEIVPEEIQRFRDEELEWAVIGEVKQRIRSVYMERTAANEEARNREENKTQVESKRQEAVNQRQARWERRQTRREKQQ